MVKRTLRFWVNEPPERCRLLWKASDELTAAYNAMLELWETEMRSETVDMAKQAKEAWVAWKSGGEKGRKPRAYKFGHEPVWRKAIMDAAKVAAPRLTDMVVRQMYSDVFCGEVARYLNRRIWDRENSSISHRGTQMPIGLNRTGCGFELFLDDKGVAHAILPMWNRTAEDLMEANKIPWELFPVDARRKEWTWRKLHSAVTLEEELIAKHREDLAEWEAIPEDERETSKPRYKGAIGGCRLVPPKKGAPKGKRRWQLHVTVQVPVEEKADEERPNVAGIDVGIHHLAVYSMPDANNHYRPSFRFWRTRELQSRMEQARAARRGVPRKRRQRIGAKLGRRQDTTCRLVAKQIMDQCYRDRVGLLRLENLTKIRERIEAEGEDPDRHFMVSARFPFYKLKQYICQAASKWGIRVEEIDAKYTSQTCSRCGHTDPSSRRGKRFECTFCGFQCDADLNAANNIASGGVQRRKPQGQPAGCIPPVAPDIAGEAVEARAMCAELQPMRVDPFSAE